MTAIVAGQGLGLINTSLGLLGDQGQLGVAGQGRSGEKVVVNAATGNLVIQQQDEWLVGVGADLVAQRTYNSLAAGSDDDNGDNWRLGYSRRIVGSSGAPTVTRVAEDGGLQTFTQVAPNTYQCKQGSGSYDTLVWANGKWTWTDGDSQSKEVYECLYSATVAQLTSITDLDGLSVTLTYDATTRLITQIKDSNNEYIKVEYDTTTKKNITSLSTYTSVNAQITQAKRVTYTYDTNTPQQRLQRVIVDLTPDIAGDSQTYATEYSYDGSSNRIKTLKQGTLAQLLAGQYNSLLSFDYVSVGSSMRIWKVTETVSGQTLTTQFSYDTVAGTTTVTDANSNQTVLSYDVSAASAGTPKEGTLLSIKQPVVNGADLTTRFTYDANGNVETVTDASGNQITYGYDANGNRTYERDGRGNVVERTFSSKNQLLTQTGYTVPAGTGLPSGATTSRYVYDTDANGGHLRFAISPLGNVTEYVYFTGGNGKGQLQYSRQYANTYSLGSMDKAVTPTLTNMTDWVASSAVDKTQQTLVEYAYDFRGQLSKQIAYNKTNASGAGLTDDNLQVVTQYFYDQAGNLLKKIDSRADEALTRDTLWARQVRKDLLIVDANGDGKTVNLLSTQDKNTIAQNAAYTTTYTYDGLNRITQQSDAQVDGQKGTITTVSVYDDTVRTTTVYKTGSSDTNNKLIEVATSVSTYDEAGHLLSLAYTNNKNQQAMGTTKYTYDKLNRLISVEVPATLPSSVGEKSYYLYDEASRKIGEVNAEGALIEYRYNKNGQVSRTIAYDTLVNMGDTTLVGKLAGGTAKLSDLGVDTDGLDKNTWYVYDKAGRLLFTLSSSDSYYDTVGDGTGFGAEVLRVHEYVYDGLGRLVSDIGHLNNVSGAKFNQLKAFTGELSYDVSTKRIYMGTPYISVSTIADDRVTRYYYDADSRRIGELDAQNYYTKSEYDARGRLIARTRYATAVASVPSTGAAPTVVTAETAYTALGQDQVSKYVYNNKGQLTGQLERAPIYNSANVYTGLGYLYTAYEYDGAGNRTKETRYETVQANTFDGTTAPTTSANDRITTYTYDANNRLLSANTTPSGHKIAYAYDAAGNLASTTTTVHRGDGGSDDVRVRRQRYDALGRLTDELSAEGAKALEGVSGEANIQAVWDKYATKYVYNDAGRRIAMIEPNGKDGLGNQTVYYYDKVGRVTHTVNALGEVTQYVYDAFGQRTRVVQNSNRAGTPSALKGGLNSLFTAPGGSASTQTDYSYTRAGELSSWYKGGQSGAPSDAQSYYYDGLGNLLEMDTAISGTKDLWTLYSYDKRGLRTSTEEQLHTTTTTTIGGVPTVTETTESLRLTQTAYDAFGRAISTTDGQDVKTETSYDTQGRVVQLKVPSGTGSAATTYTYDAFGRTLGSKDRSGQTTSYVYDDVLGEITVLTPEAGLLYTSVNSAGQTVSTTDARGNTVTYSYDKDGRLTETRVLDTNGSTVLSSTKTRYDMAGRVKEVEDSRGTITSLTYDKAGRVLSRTVDSASGGLALTTLYRYDAKGQAVWTRDANGTWTKTNYSKKGDVLTVVTDPAKIPSGTVAANEDKTGDDLSQDANLIDNPASGGALALETAYTYNAKGQTLTVTQRKSGDVAALLKTNYTYDALGRRNSETVDPGGKNLTTTYEYDKNNRVTKKIDAEQQVTRYVYDEEGRQRFMVDGNGALTQYTYDINGRLSQTCHFAALVVGAAAMSDAQIADAATANANPSADQVTTNIYDKMGRLKYARDALGNLTQYDYDLNGNVIKTTRYGKQASPAPTVDTAKSVGLLKTYTIVLGTLADATKDQVTRNYYDAANRLTWTLQYDYDASANPTQKVFAQYYQYDAGGNLVATRRFANAVQNTPTAGTAPQIIAQGADAPSSSVCYVRQDDSNDPIVYKSYDKANRLKFVVDGEGYVTQNDYDNLGNLKSSIRFANAATFGSGFAAGNEVSVLDVGAAATGLKCWVFKAKTTDVNQDRIASYGWDAAGRETTETVTDRASQTLSSVKKAYDAAGHLTDVTDAYGTGQDVTTHYNYDSAGRLIEEIKANGTSAQASTRYKLDNLGQRTEIVDPRGVEAAESNSDWAQSARAALLAAGKISSSALPVKDSVDYKAILKAYTTTQVFDAQGHVTQIIDPLGGTTNTNYDAFGNAIRVQDPNGNYGYFVFNQLNQSTWAIDPMGYATQTEYDALGQVSKITKYGNDVKNLSAIWSNTSKTTKAPTFYPDQAAFTAANGSVTPSFAYLIGSPDVMSGLTLVSAGTDAVTKIEHDLLGRQTKITDAENYTESMQYDALGNKTSYTNKLGGVYTYKYDRVGNLQEETLPVKVYQYDDTGAVLSSSRDGEGKPNTTVRNRYSYDARGNRTKAIEALNLPEQRATTYTYDALDRQVTKSGQLQDVYVTADGSSLVNDGYMSIVGATVTKTRPVTTWGDAAVHSADGYVGGACVSFSAGATNSYFMVGLSTKPNAENGYASTDWALYCNAGTLLVYSNGSLQPLDSPQTYQTSNVLSVSYDGQTIRFLKDGVVFFSKVVSITQALYADATICTASASINALTFAQSRMVNGVSTNQVTPTETTSYDARGNVIESRAADGGRTLYFYDALNRKTAQVTPTGTLSTYNYNRTGDLLSTTTYGDAVNPQDPLTPIDGNNARTTFYGYDRVGRQLTSTIKNIETGEINASTGNYEVRVQDLVNSKTYDANGNVTSETDARGNPTWHYYDLVGNLIAQVDTERYLTVWTHDAGGHIKTQKAYAEAIPTGFELTANSKPNVLLALINANNARETQYAYDRMARLKTQTVLAVNANKLTATGTITDADSPDAVTTFGYNGAGNLIRKVEATTEVLDWSYDLQGREKESQGASFTDYNAQTVRQTTDTEYNALGLKVRSIEKGDGVLTDRVTYTAYGINGMTARLIDAVGNITWLQHDAAGRITLKRISRQTADSTGTPAVVSSSDLTAQTDITAYSYDNMGRQIKQQLYSVSGYNAALPTAPDLSQMLQTIEVSYDTYGEIVGKSTYGAKRLWSPTDPYSFISVWDKPTEWQEKTTYDAAGRAIISNAGTGVTKGYVFDANGNLTLTIESAGSADLTDHTIDQMLIRTDTHLTASKYDHRNRLIDSLQPKIANATDTTALTRLNNQNISTPSMGVVLVGAQPKQQNVSAANQVAHGVAQLAENMGAFAANYSCIISGDLSHGFNLDIWGAINLPDTSILGDGDLVLSYPQIIPDTHYDYRTKTVSLESFFGAWAHSGNGHVWGFKPTFNIPVRKNTPQGQITIATIKIVANTTVSNAVATSTPVISSSLIRISAQPLNTASIAFCYKSKTIQNASWIMQPITPYWVQGNLIPGMFVFDASGVLADTYDFIYTALDPEGRALNSQSGTWKLNLASSTIDQNQNADDDAPNVLLDSLGKLNFIRLGENAKSAKIQVRLRGDVRDWDTISATPLISGSLNCGAGVVGTTGCFSISPQTDLSLPALTGPYDYLITTYGEDVKPITRMVGNFIVGDVQSVTVGSPVFVENLPTTVHFQNLSTFAAYARLAYKPSSTSSWQTGKITLVSPGSFDWDAMSAAPVPTQTYGLDYELQVFDAGGLMLNNLSGSAVVGANRSASPANNLMPASNTLVFNPGLVQASSMQLHFRPVGNTQIDYTVTTHVNAPLVASDPTTFTALNILSWAQGLGLIPTQGGVDFEYYYEVYDDHNQLLTGGEGWPKSPGRFHLDAANQAVVQAKTVVLGFANPAQVAHSSQELNAYDEVVSQTDASGNKTTFKYNALGKLIEKDDPKVSVTTENGYHDLALKSPVTKYYFDLQGRLIGTQDANLNINLQSWVAEGVDGQSREYMDFYADLGRKSSAYDIFGDLRTVTSLVGSKEVPGSITTSYKYDSDHRLTTITRPLRSDQTVANSETFYYDAAGNRIKHTTSPDGITIYTDKTDFDALGRISKTVSPQGIVLNNGRRVLSYTYFWDSTIKGVTGTTVGGWIKITKNGIQGTDDFTHFDLPVPATLPTTLTYTSDVFGHQLGHTDLGGHVFTYAYNAAGWLTDQTSIGTGAQYTGQDIHYDYYADGRIEDILDNSQLTQTLYGYDANGNKTYEGYATQTNGFLSFYQQSTILYDGLNRVQSINDTQYVLKYEYDAVGNRRRVTEYNGSSNSASQDLWYKYDCMNRFTMTMGQLYDTTNKVVVTDTTLIAADDTTKIIRLGAINTSTVTNSAVQLGYDKAGNRTSATYGRDGRTERYSYTEDGYLKNVYITPDSGTEWLASSRVVDLLGRVTSYSEYSAAGVFKDKQAYLYDADGKVQHSDSINADPAIGNSSTGNLYIDGTLWRSATNGVITTYQYAWWDSPLQAKITASQSGNPTPGTSTFTYDANGHVNSVVDSAGGRNLRYVNNAQGLILRRDEISSSGTSGGTSNKFESYYYFDGNRVGETGNNSGPSQVDYAQALANTSHPDRKTANKAPKPITSSYDQNYQAIDANYPGFSSSRYLVSGKTETLSSVASGVWGDATLWYLIAEANGLSADTPLTQGQTLIIPNKVTNVHNSSATHAVYDPSEAMGDTSPTMPDPPPPPAEDDGCGGVGVILMVVVAIAVTALTAGALGPVMGQMLAMGIGAMAGSAASQAVGMMTGNVKEFSWSAVGRAGVTAAVTAGMGELAGASETYANAMQAVSNATTLSTITLNAMATNLMAQQVNRALGLQQGKFSWTAVASAGVNSAMNQWLGGSQVGKSLAAFDSTGTVYGTTAGILNGWADSMLHHDKPQWAGIAANAFGSALGDAVVGSIRQADAEKQQRDQTYGLASGDGKGGLKLGGYRGPRLAGDTGLASTTAESGEDDTRVVRDFDPEGQSDDGWSGNTSRQAAGSTLADARDGVTKGLGRPLGEVSKVKAGGQTFYKWVDENGSTQYTGYDPTPQTVRDPVPGSNSAEVGKRAMANLTAEAKLNEAWDAQEASDQAAREKRQGFGGVLRGANDFGVNTVRAPYDLARSVRDNGLYDTGVMVLEGWRDTPSRLWNAAQDGDAQTLTEAGAGLIFGLKGPRGSGLVKGMENEAVFSGLNEARSAAHKLSGLGDNAVDFVQEIGPAKGQITGRMSPDGLRGWRLDFDDGKGLHVNWWDRSAGVKRSEWVYGANKIEGGTQDHFWDLLQHFPKK